MILAWLLLLTGLILSAVAIYYSVVGLTAIFSAAIIPIIVMGTSLEVAKLVCASWLKANWERAPRYMKYYMISAVTVLMLITSMGIFGFLSKAHNDQNLVSGDVTSKIAIYDEKIKTEKENIEANRKALKQMDEGVDQVLGRSADEKGADKAVALRRSQQKERTRLQAEISQSQKLIAELNDARAPIAAEVRKVEAEVGPIKYIAKFIYGDKGADENFLEKAVTWIIILIVTVFDPLAVIMLLGAQMTFAWSRDEKEQGKMLVSSDGTIVGFTPDLKPEPVTAEKVADVVPEAVEEEESKYEPLHCYKCGTELMLAPGIGPFCPNKDCDVLDKTDPAAEPIEFVYTAPAAQSSTLWPFPAVVKEPEVKPKKERKPRKSKNTEKEKVADEPKPEDTPETQTTPAVETIKDPVKTPKAKKVKPARDLDLERKQAEILEAIIESTSAPSIVSATGTLGDSPVGTVTPPADNVPVRTGTVGAPLPGDEYYNKTDADVKYQEEELKPTPRRSEAGGWFPNKTK